MHISNGKSHFWNQKFSFQIKNALLKSKFALFELKICTLGIKPPLWGSIMFVNYSVWIGITLFQPNFVLLGLDCALLKAYFGL